MPRFFIDVDDGERRVRDDAGIDLKRVEDVAVETEHLLFVLGHAVVANGRNRVFHATVRDAEGRAVYRGSATLRIERVAPPHR